MLAEVHLDRSDIPTHTAGMLLLLRKHVLLLRLQVLHRMRVWPSHAGLHAHHGPRLAHGAVGT